VHTYVVVASGDMSEMWESTSVDQKFPLAVDQKFPLLINAQMLFK
jgi:hypothetical protein